jgi:hypothetical protein
MSPHDYSQQSAAPGGGGHAVDYTSYPEVVEAERAVDSSPQVRMAGHFSEDHAMSSKMSASEFHHPHNQQPQHHHFSPGYAGAAAMTPGMSGGQSPTTTVGASTVKDGPVVGETKALPAVPAVPAAYSSDKGGGHGGAAAEGGSNKMYSRKVVYILVGLLILVMVLAGAIGGAVGSKAVNDAKT